MTRKLPLGELLQLILDHRGKTPLKLGGDFTSDGYPVLSARHVKTDQLIATNELRYVSPDMYQAWMKEPLQREDVVLTSEAPLGEVYLLPDDTPYVLGQRLFGLRAKAGVIEPGYLAAWLASPKGQEALQARATGTTATGIRQSELLKIEVDVPPLSQQRMTADFRRVVNAKIELNRRMAATLEEMARTIFRSWFVDFDPVRAKIAAKAEGRDPERAAMAAISGKTDDELDELPREQFEQLAATAALFPDEMVESELGDVPYGWHWSTIGQEVSVVGGGTPSTTNADFWDGDYFWATPKDLSGVNDKVLTSTARRITKAGVATISSGQLPPGTVLLSSRAPIGYLALAAVPVSINQGFIAMICNGRLPSTFVLQWAAHNLDAIKGRGSGTTFAEISKANFRPLKVIVSDSKVLANFQKSVHTLYFAIVERVNESRSLVTLRDLLLPKLLSGEILVSELPDAVTPCESME